MLGISWWRRGRLTRRDLLATAPLFVLSALLAVVTIWFQHHHAIGSIPTRPEGFLSRLAAAGMVPWFYLYKVLVPVNLSMIYPRWHVDVGSVLSYLPGIALLGCLGVCWIYRRTWGRWPLAGLGCFVVVLFPVLGFFEMAFARKSLVADHLQYVAIIGPITLVAAAGWTIGKRLTGEGGRAARFIVAGSLLATLSVLTFMQGFVFTSAEAMWTDVLKKNPDCPEAHYEIALRLTDEGRLQEALDHYLKAIALRADYSEAHNNLGDLYIRLGDIPHAGYHFAMAIRYTPGNYRARFNLALTQYRVGATHAAAENLRRVVAGSPDYPPALNTLAKILAADPDEGLRNGPDAVSLARRACRLTAPTDPILADRMNTLAMAYAESGQFDLAIQTAQTAAEIARNTGDENFEKEILWRIEQYKEGKPARIRIAWPGPPASGQASQPASDQAQRDR